MKFFLLLGDLPPPSPPDFAEGIPLPQPVTILIAGAALAAAVFLTLYGLLRKRGRGRAWLIGLLVAAVVFTLAAVAANRSARRWQHFQQQQGGGRTHQPWEYGPPSLPPPDLGPAPAVAPPT